MGDVCEQWCELCRPERVTFAQILNVLEGPVKVCVDVGRCWDLGKSL